MRGKGRKAHHDLALLPMPISFHHEKTLSEYASKEVAELGRLLVDVGVREDVAHSTIILGAENRQL